MGGRPRSRRPGSGWRTPSWQGTASGARKLPRATRTLAMSRDRPDKHQVVFRKSNLIVSVHYTEDHGLGDDPDPADMRATTLKLAAEIQSKINA